ncbi:MAG: glycosyltransferase [Ginsengibacter sp.]
MSRIPLSAPFIPALPENKLRPLWSVMIPVYNCIQFLEETLRSVLGQCLPESEMQIEVVDDASTDGNVEEMVAAVGKGRIGYFRQPENVGSIRNFETCIIRAGGYRIHLLHGDDKIRMGYYEKMNELFKKYPEAGAAFCRFINIDDKGAKCGKQPPESIADTLLPNWFPKIASYQRIQYCAITVKREVYEKLGSFYALTYAEDWEMWVRAAKHYAFAYTPEILAEYRKHLQSISGTKFSDAQYLRDLQYAMQLIQIHVHEKDRKKILSRSKKFYAHYAVKTAEQLHDLSYSKKAVNNSIVAGTGMHKDLHLYYKIAKLYIKMYARKLLSPKSKIGQ